MRPMLRHIPSFMRLASLRMEFSWFFAGLVVAVLAGFLLGMPTLIPLLFLISFSAYQLVRMAQVEQWLRQSARVADAPPTYGMSSQIIGLIHREKKYSRKQKNRYRSTLAQFNNLAAELPDATLVLDELHQILWANAAAQTLLAIHPDKDHGQRIDNLVRDPQFHDFLRHEDPTMELELEVNGSNTSILAIRRVPADRGMSVLIARDVTQRVRVREMRRAFVGNVSHELRTPLTVIRGYLEMLQEEEDLPADVTHGLNIASGQADRMTQIVEHLLELSNLEGNPLGIDEGDTLRMPDLLRSLADGVSRTLGKQHDITLKIDDNLYLRGNERELYSACQNLLSNAIRHTPPGTLVELSWELDGLGRPTMAVRDEGPGIESRHLPRLSERFYRVDKGRSRAAGGTGLGLAIVKHAAQRHGGELLIDSSPGQGSRFAISLPAQRAATNDEGPCGPPIHIAPTSLGRWSSRAAND